MARTCWLDGITLKQGYVKVAFFSLTILLAALLDGLHWVLWRREAPPEHPRKSLEERSEEESVEGAWQNLMPFELP